jgi:hypothetical protein
MALATYSDLQTSIANFLHRTDLTAIIPDFITLAEIRINGDLDARLQDVKTTLTTTVAVDNVALPSDVINIRHLSVASSSPMVTMQFQTPDTLVTRHAYNTSGTPSAYTVIGTSIYMQPVPDTAYTLNLIYKGRVPSLSAAVSGTTWLMTNYPHVYLYGALCESAPYLKDDARIAVWEQKYSEAIDTVNTQDWYSGNVMMSRAG